MAGNCTWKISGKLPKGTTNYAHAWMKLEGKFLTRLGILDFDKKASLHIDGRDFSRNAAASAAPNKQTANNLSKDQYGGGTTIPMPIGSSKGSPPDPADIGTTAARLPNVADDTVIVGIVDTGIALAHRRFRDKEGNTRFLASWQQSAKYGGQGDLPCGREVYAAEINDALHTHSCGNMTGYLDEDAFNRDLELTDLVRPLGNRDLELSAAHGTNVLDLATGLDPEFADSEDMRRQRIIAVNLPAQYSHGSAGNFLAYFSVYAFERILHIADAQWHKKHPIPEEGKIMGFPIVINFSYGMQAGPKDGQHIFENALKEIIEARKLDANAEGWQGASPVRVAMPAGNDNLLRGAASIVMGENGSKSPTVGYEAKELLELPWRIKPADATANFLEIWTEAKGAKIFQDVLKHMKVCVTPPNGPEAQLTTLADRKTQVLGTNGFARAYVQHLKGYTWDGKGKKAKKKDRNYEEGHRLSILIAVAATNSDLHDAPIAPAGQWQVKITYDREPVDVTLFIQSDQSAVRVSQNGLRSYFDHEAYLQYLENGALADNYSIDPDGKNHRNHDNWAKHGPVQRKGTQNAMSSLEKDALVVIGGYNDEDGYPAPYSASTDGDRQASRGRTIITVSYPSENGGQFGLLAAGARDGSVKAYRGTSMATALATRDIATAFLNGGADHSIGTEYWLRRESDKFEKTVDSGNLIDRWGNTVKWPSLPSTEGKLKVGAGFMPMPDLSRQWTRLGRGQ